MCNTVIYIGYTLEEWSDLLEALGAHEDTQEVAFEIMDDVAQAVEDCPNAIQLYEEPIGWRHWALRWFNERLAAGVPQTDNK